MANKETKQISDGTAKENDQKIIKDPKVIYLIRTLSRTKKKDYENYVINAIWNKLDNDNIEIITQQYIYNPDSKREDGKNRYFIDLYFPALNIGIECNEAHHYSEENKEKDVEREKDIISYFYTRDIDDKENYVAIHIDVTKTYDEVQEQIENAVAKIKDKIENLEKENKLPDWKILTPEDYYKEKSEIKVSDRVGFETNKDVCNILFNTGYAESMRISCFEPRSGETFKDTEYEGYQVWFPQLAVQVKDGGYEAKNSKKIFNFLEDNGKTIRESKPDNNEREKNRKIVFAKSKDLLGRIEYNFVGIFEYAPKKTDDNYFYYKRVSDVCNYGGVRDKGKKSGK